MHHVLVAKDLIARGSSVDSLVNHVIEYVMVVGESLELAALDVNSFIRSLGKENERVINKKYYKEKEIFPAVERMLEEVEGIDLKQIKEKFIGKKELRKPERKEEDEGSEVE